jgi:predicted HAD superfamily Cof-like phosphohydrolase
MSKVFTDVGVFMRAAGQTVGSKNSDQSELYKKLILEEFQEFVTAENLQKEADTLDACFDMMWVIIGYMHSRGWDCERAWDEGARSNMAKIDRETGFVKRRADGKILKPEGWQPPNFEKLI